MDGNNDHPALVGIFTRAARNSAGSWNEETRTVDVLMSSGAAVARRSYEDGPYSEVLEISANAVDLSRCDGMSVLDSHSPYSMENRVGTIVGGSVRIAGGNLVGVIRLSRNELGESLAQDLRDGHPFHVSVGYSVSDYRWEEGVGDTLPVLTATRWLPMELSVVAIPADAAARTRSLQRNDPMPNIAAPVEDEVHDRGPYVSPEVRAERTRVAELQAVATRFPRDVTPEILSRAINNGVSVAAFRVAMLDAIVDRQEAADIFPHTARHDGSASRQNDTIAALTANLAGKPGPSGIAIARQYLEGNSFNVRGMSDRDIGRAVMTSGQASVWGGGTRAMHATGDFAFLVGQAASNVLLERFEATPSALKRFSRLRNAPDFRDVKFFRPGEAPPLLKVNEHGEIRSGTMSEESNGFRIDTYARIFSLTFQASVNDGLGAFSDFLSAFAEGGITLESDIFAALLDGNGPRLDDGLFLFSQEHGNLAASPTALSIESISEGVLSMRTQRNTGGTGTAGTTPAALLVGPALETRAKQLVATIAATTTDNVNPHRLDVVVEDRFGRGFRGWFLLADPARRPAFLHGGLESEGSAPKVETREGWEVLGVQYRVVHHFGAGIHDYRAIYFNPGE